jgi:hypothetical protein
VLKILANHDTVSSNFGMFVTKTEGKIRAATRRGVLQWPHSCISKSSLRSQTNARPSSKLQSLSWPPAGQKICPLTSFPDWTERPRHTLPTWTTTRPPSKRGLTENWISLQFAFFQLWPSYAIKKTAIHISPFCNLFSWPKRYLTRVPIDGIK